MRFQVTNINLPKFSKFTKAANTAKNKLNALVIGIPTPENETFQQVIDQFKNILQQTKPTLPSFTSTEWAIIVHQLIQDESLFNEAMDAEVVLRLLEQLLNHHKVRMIEMALQLFFRYYAKFEHTHEALWGLFIYELNRHLIQRGMIPHVQNNIYELQNSPKLLLKKYNHNLKKIYSDFQFKQNYEYYNELLLIKLTEDLRSLDIDEVNNELFNEILEKQNTIVLSEKITIRTLAVCSLLDKAMTANKPIANWVKFISQMVEDPRAYRKQLIQSGHWREIDQVDTKYRKFYVKLLSKEDLRYFLEEIDESVRDTNYKYRKHFWLAFADYVHFAKLIVSHRLLEKDFIIKEKVENNPSIYGTIQDSERSFIYLDFGSFHVIEGTHSACVRFYKTCPIDLYQKDRYKYDRDFYGFKLKKKTVYDEYIHSGPEAYSWQKKLLPILNRKLGTNVTLVEIKISRKRY